MTVSMPDLAHSLPPLPLSPLRGDLDHRFWPRSQHHPAVEWRRQSSLTDYDAAMAFMQDRAEQIYHGTAREMVWLIEHPPLYTAGTSAKPEDLLKADFLPVFASGRGGEYTYHGPGQRIAYVMLDLRARRQDVRAFVAALEAWIIGTLALFGVTAERRENRVGVWVVRPDKAKHDKAKHDKGKPDRMREDKIAAIGIRLKRWVSFHGIAVNIAPDLSHYDGIVPCGIQDHGVTSLADLGLSISMAQFDAALQRSFHDIFGSDLLPTDSDELDKCTLDGQ